MRLKIFLFMFVSIISFFLISCSSSDNIIKDRNIKVDTLALVNNDVISLKDYEDFYLKNNGGPTALQNITDENKKDFLDLLVKYRLKINDARKKGYDKDPAIIAEIKEYEKSLAVLHAIEKEIIEPNVKMWYERRKQNLKIYAIMVRANFNNPADTLERYNFIYSLLDSLNRGVNFKKLALRYSEIGTGDKADSGLLSYISAGQTVANFEDAIYSLKVGEYTKKPVKLRTGYIIPLLEEIEPRTGGKHFCQVLLQFRDFNYEDSMRVINLANDIKRQIDEGASFEKMVDQYSEDESRLNGGSIGTFERDPRLPAFWNKIFALKPGEVSDPIITEYGIHIIKCTHIIPYPSYEEMKPNLRDEYNAIRNNDDRNNYINRLKAKYKYTTNIAVLNEFYKGIDTVKPIVAGIWDSLVTNETRRKVLITLDNKKFTVDSIIKTIKNMPEFANYILLPHRFQTIMDRLADRFILEHRATFVPAEHPDFKEVMQEYVDGILLYKAEQEAVWNKLVIDDDALKKYYEDNKEQFWFTDRVEFAEIFVTNDSVAQQIYKELTDTLTTPTKKGVKPKKIVPPAFEDMVKKYTERPDYKENKGYWGLHEETDNVLAMHALEARRTGIYRPIRFDNGWSIIKVYKFYPAIQKELDECGPELSTKYQDYETKRLERLWMESLREQFPVKTFPEVLQKAFNVKTE